LINLYFLVVVCFLVKVNQPEIVFMSVGTILTSDTYKRSGTARTVMCRLDIVPNFNRMRKPGKLRLH
jgi:hypothetical protein